MPGGPELGGKSVQDRRVRLTRKSRTDNPRAPVAEVRVEPHAAPPTQGEISGGGSQNPNEKFFGAREHQYCGGGALFGNCMMG
jgi:hypothetical protein